MKRLSAFLAAAEGLLPYTGADVKVRHVLGSDAGGWKVVGQGSFGSRHWAVEASPDRGGVCLEDLVFSAGRRATALGAGQCSHPVAARGSLVVAVALSEKVWF